MNFQDLLYRFFRALAWFLACLPKLLVGVIAVGFANGVYALFRLSPYRDAIRTNLRAAFGPDPARVDLDAIARQHLIHLSRAIAEVLCMPRRDVASLVRISGWEHVEAARDAGKGLLIVTAHFGNWELLGAAIAQRGVPLHVLVQPPSQDAFGRLFAEFRGVVGVTSWPNNGAASLRPALRALARNEAVGLLADQHGESQDAIVTFFGRPVSAPGGPFFLARRTGAALLPCFIVREANGTHVLHIEKALPVTPDVRVDAQALYALYERYIRCHPDHWLWVHDRWAREAELRCEREPAAAVLIGVGA